MRECFEADVATDMAAICSTSSDQYDSIIVPIVHYVFRRSWLLSMVGDVPISTFYFNFPILGFRKC